MASGTITADYPGRPYYLRLQWSTASTNVAGNTSTYNWTLSAVSKSGWGSYNYACGNWYLHIAGYNYSGCKALVFIPGDFAGKTIVLASGTTGPVTHDAQGYLRFQIAFNHQAPGPFGTADAGWRWVDGTRIPKVPPAPKPIGLDTVTNTSMRYRFQSQGDGGSPIIRWEYQYSTSATFASGNSAWLTSTGTSTATGLTPGVKYYFRSRGVNAVGNGPASAIISATTIPSTAPGLVITPLISGIGATATMSPPGGVTGVTEYNVQYRPAGGSPTIDRSTTTTVVQVTSGLIPGAEYEWRANAEIGGYTSPWTDWMLVPQPSPNTNAGDFFSGATGDTADTDYVWTGDAHNSVSRALMNVVDGWRSFGEGNADSGGTGIVGQADSTLTGPFIGEKLVKVIFHSDADGEGFIAGIDWDGAGEVEVGSEYFGSLYFRVPNRDQRVQAGIAWYNAAQEVFDITWGDEVAVTGSNSIFTRLAASGEAPVGALRGAPVLRDVSGVGWATWAGGDVFFMDAAMLTLNSIFPYFDGDTPDSKVLGYDYRWLGGAHESASVRYNVANPEPPDPLADPDCTPVPAPPSPPAIPSDCIVEVGVWRQYYVQVPAGEVRQWSVTLPTLVLRTGSVAERQVRIRFYPNPDGVAPEAVDTRVWEAEMILTYIPPNTVITLDSVTRRVRAEVGGTDPISANHLLYGTNGTPATWPELRCGIGYLVTLDVPTDAPSGNMTADLILTQRV